ncbi:insulin receptor substrate 2 [Ambystoma mexicanum]|uniref:insulin receptor substrate 2 n=1 Tax=Ambystoma mexicanum TaxID=8296 RepID=UPI0037E71567
MASPPLTGSPEVGSSQQSVRKSGYLRKQKHGHKRFFVLLGPGALPGEPARLEYYENEKKWRSKPAKRSIVLDSSCLSVNKRADAKHRHLIALYTRDEYLAMAADSEAEQEGWYQALSDLLSQGRGGGCAACREGGSPGSGAPCGSCGAAPEDPDYGLVTPASQVYREVWQVTVKPKGLGQSRHLTGLHRLCLSGRSVSFVRPNAETPAARLQLMNIRRCGHSDSFFFMELGRSAAIGPGELWMQADDAVVAQSIHETILEAMRAMRELAELRPRSQSQSTPISVPVPRRHTHSHPPPSQTGLPARRARTDSSSSATPPASAPCARVRTASEGDRTMVLSPCALRTHLSRSNTLAGPRPLFYPHPRLPPPGALQHSRSMSMPVPRSPPSAASPVSLCSSSSGHGSESSAAPRPSSCGASTSCSPSDAGFMSLDEYSSSPGEVGRPCPRGGAAHHHRSGTPESVSETPPTPGRELNGYMCMERPPSGLSLCPRHYYRLPREDALDPAHRKRTYSLTTPARQRSAPQVSSASLDEATLLRAVCRGTLSRTASPKLPYHPYPEDYGDVQIGSTTNLGDDGYMPMVPGAVLATKDYMPMSCSTVSAPQQILRPRTGSSPQMNGYKTGESSPEDSGYMRMMCGAEGRLGQGTDYLNMSPGSQASATPPDCFFQQSQVSSTESEQYVLMHSPGRLVPEEAQLPVPPLGFFHRCRAVRPTRLALDSVRTMPSMTEHPPAAEPHSPGGEYINIDFGERYSPAGGASPGSDYMNLDCGGRSPRSGPVSLEAEAAYCRVSCPSSPRRQQEDEDYTEMSFGSAAPTPPQPICTKPEPTATLLPSPTAGVQRLSLLDHTTTFPPLPLPDPDRGAKVIRADPLGGRRRHSSETFSSTTTVTPVSPSFAHSPKRHSSASVENVSVPRRSPGGEGSPEAVPTIETGGGSPMCRETSAGFQNGLNHIHISREWTEPGANVRPLMAAGDGAAYASMDFFLTHTFREAASGKRGKELLLTHDLAPQSTT